MDATRFDQVTRRLSGGSSRRELLGGVAVALGLATARFPDEAWAKKRRRKGKKRRKHTPLAFNEYGCVAAGRPCRGDDANCCSGVCAGTAPKQGEPDKSRCAGHNALTCTDGQDSTTQGNISCGADGLCLQTTGQAEFCGRIGFCAVCQRDEDCEATKGPGAACVVNVAACPGTGGTACYAATV